MSDNQSTPGIPENPDAESDDQLGSVGRFGGARPFGSAGPFGGRLPGAGSLGGAGIVGGGDAYGGIGPVGGGQEGSGMDPFGGPRTIGAMDPFTRPIMFGAGGPLVSGGAYVVGGAVRPEWWADHLGVEPPEQPDRPALILRLLPLHEAALVLAIAEPETATEMLSDLLEKDQELAVCLLADIDPPKAAELIAPFTEQAPWLRSLPDAAEAIQRHAADLNLPSTDAGQFERIPLSPDGIQGYAQQYGDQLLRWNESDGSVVRSTVAGQPTLEDLTAVVEQPAGPVGSDEPSGPQRYLRGQCPDTVRVGKPFSLIVSVGLTGSGNAAALEPFDVPAGGQDVDLVLDAPGLRVLGDQELTLQVPASGDSRPKRFELRADGPGTRSICVTAWLSGSYLGGLDVEVVAEHDAAVGANREVAAEISTEASAGAVSLVVRFDPDQKCYRFEFRDEDNPEQVISALAFEPRPRIELLLADLDRVAQGYSGYSPPQIRDYLVNAGVALWEELVPRRLREQFWERQGRIRQLTILSDNDTVPWELLYPKDPGHDAGFLVEQFPVTRGIFGQRPAPRLSLRPARFVLSGQGLAEAQAEVDAMRLLLSAGQPADDVISALTPLQQLIKSGDFGLLHFACHNRFHPDSGSSITLGNVEFTPTLMTTAASDKVLARTAPTVFMNACRSAGANPAYNELDSWAIKFLRAGAAAFIGSLWDVSDGAARVFAEEFYSRLKSGAPLGQAAMDARTVAASQPGDPTWLAYTVYGNPNAKIAPALT